MRINCAIPVEQPPLLGCGSLNFCFPPFEVRAAERVLLHEGAACPIGSRAFDVLLALIERRDRVVTKNELLDIAWPGVVVEENNLSVQISTLRKVLGASAIATVIGRGYRFTLPCVPAGTTPVSPPQVQVERRIVAIACAEVVDWHALLDADSESAVRAWRTTRTNTIESQLARFGGQAIEITPERLLIRFDSSVDAVAWAMDLQDRLTHSRHNGDSPRLHMRVGVILEDAIIDGGKLVGDLVQLAERLEQAGGEDDIIVTDVVRDLSNNRLPVTFRSLGEQHPSSYGRPVQVYRVVPETRRSLSAVASPSLMWDRLPTVAVLPFDSGETDTYFGDGITEEIITGLSMNRSLFVIARDSALRFRGAGASASAAAELGVRYILVGSVRRIPPRLRINVELIDTSLNCVIWSPEPFTGVDADLFAFQSEIAARIVAAIDPSIREAEINRVRNRPSNVFGAYDYVLRGLSAQFGDRQDFERAGECFRRAIEIDPEYAQAHAHLARWHSMRVGEGRSDAPDEDRAVADQLSRRAIELDPRDAWVLATGGHIQSFLHKRFAAALDMFDQALRLNPNCVMAWCRSGTTLAYIGRGEEALERVRNAMRLSPFDHQTFSFYTTNGIASIVNGRYDEAVSWLSRALRLKPRYRAAARLHIAALGLAGELAEARERAQEFLLAEPTFNVERFGEWYPLQAPYLERVLQGLRLAQLPG